MSLFIYCNVECHYVEWRYAECRGATLDGCIRDVCRRNVIAPCKLNGDNKTAKTKNLSNSKISMDRQAYGAKSFCQLAIFVQSGFSTKLTPLSPVQY